MDNIKIQNLEVFAKHGVLKEENVLGQKFLISVILQLDIKEAGLSDDLTKSVHYGEVCHFIKKFMEEHTFYLIEAAAEQLTRDLLASFSKLRAVTLEIKKPWAPIGLPIDTVSVEINRGWHLAYIAFGSNVGDKEGHIRRAVNSMETDKAFRIGKISDIITTKPYGNIGQDDFLNGCLEIETYLDPFELLEKLHQLEKEASRKRTVRWGPRTLDLDILLYDDMVLDTETLHIPHMDMHNRNFVLEPMVQIAPFKRHPVFYKTMEELLKELKAL